MAYCYDYPRAALTADALVFRKNENNQTEVLLIRRKNPPFEGKWALPGGFMDIDETLEQCVSRELQEETGLYGIEFRQANAYSAIDRDPRHRTVSLAFVGWAAADAKPKAGSDSAEVRWFSISNLPELAFDHFQIINDSIALFTDI
jgi:8-oxo-dGTP diphosphatase